MDTLTISAAAHLCRCDRRTLQRSIHSGRLHLDAQHCLSREELLAAGYLITETPRVTLQGTPHDVPQATPQLTPYVTPQAPPQTTPQVAPQLAPLLGLLERLTTAIEGVWQSLEHLREDLRQTPQRAPQATPRDTPQPSPQDVPQGTPQVAPQVAPQKTPQGTPRASSYDPTVVIARIRALRAEGLSLAQIAAHLNTEGVPTRRGQAWGKALGGWFLKHYGVGVTTGQEAYQNHRSCT
jgi:hypothetical protein